MDDSAALSVELRIRDLERAWIKMNADLQWHMMLCNKRSARLEKLAWATGTIVVSILGLLLKAYFHYGP